MPDNKLRLNTKALDTLSLLQMEGDPDVVVEITELFLSTAPGKVEKIERHIADGQVDLARKEAHGLKSSAYSLGAEVLATLCQQIEDLDAAQIDTKMMQTLRQEYTFAEAELKKIISQRP